MWTAGRTIEGDRFEVPASMTVTSTGDVTRSTHFALVCSTSVPLQEADQPEIRASQLRNLLSDTPVGHSQVTAVVTDSGVPSPGGAVYERGFVARLVAPYFVTLTHYVELATGDATSEKIQLARESRGGGQMMIHSRTPTLAMFY